MTQFILVRCRSVYIQGFRGPWIPDGPLHQRRLPHRRRCAHHVPPTILYLQEQRTCAWRTKMAVVKRVPVQAVPFLYSYHACTFGLRSGFSHTRARTFIMIPVATVSLTQLMTAMITLPFPTPITLHGGRHRILVRYRCVLARASLARLDRPVSPALGTSSGGGIALCKNPLVKPPL